MRATAEQHGAGAQQRATPEGRVLCRQESSDRNDSQSAASRRGARRGNRAYLNGIDVGVDIGVEVGVDGSRTDANLAMNGWWEEYLVKQKGAVIHADPKWAFLRGGPGADLFAAEKERVIGESIIAVIFLHGLILSI